MPYSIKAGKLESFIWLSQYRTFHGQLQEICDVGCGMGMYRQLFDSLFPHARWTGIEIWEPYIKEYKLDQQYNRIIWENALKLFEIHSSVIQGPWDLMIFGDILEHMSKEDAYFMVGNALSCSRSILISIPLGVYKNTRFGGNPYEDHLSVWSHRDVMRMLSTLASIANKHSPEKIRIETLYRCEVVGKGHIGVYVVSNMPSSDDRLDKTTFDRVWKVWLKTEKELGEYRKSLIEQKKLGG